MDDTDGAPTLGEKSLEWLEFWPENEFKVEDLNMNSNSFSWVQQADQQQAGPTTAIPAPLSVPQTTDAGLLFPGQAEAVSAALLGQFTQVVPDGLYAVMLSTCSFPCI